MGDDRVLAALGETAQAFGGYLEGLQQVASSGVLTPDLSAGNLLVLTLTGDATVAAPTVVTTGRGVGFVLVAIQDATGGHALTWDAAFRWPDGAVPVVGTAPGAEALFGLTTYNDGAHWLGSLAGTNYA